MGLEGAVVAAWEAWHGRLVLDSVRLVREAGHDGGGRRTAATGVEQPGAAVLAGRVVPVRVMLRGTGIVRRVPVDDVVTEIGQRLARAGKQHDDEQPGHQAARDGGPASG